MGFATTEDKMKKINFTLLLAGLIVSQMAVCAPLSTTITYNNVTYDLESRTVTPDADVSSLTSNPWWGDPAFSEGLATAVLSSLDPTLMSPTWGALFAFDLSEGYLSSYSWNSTDNTSPFAAILGTLSAEPEVYVYLVNDNLQHPIITIESLYKSLSSSTKGLGEASSTANLLANGAHSRPLSRLVGVGEKTFWVAGDWGNDDHGNRSGSVGVAEMGGGYNFGFAQINASLGKTWNKQNIVFDGTAEIDGKYFMVESTIPVSKVRGLYATVGAYRIWGKANINRGYDVLGTVEYSQGNTNTQTVGARARLDWENAFSVKLVQVSPYIDVNIFHSKIDGYSETGIGSLPATYDSSSMNSNEIRAGLNASMPLPVAKMNLVMNIEAAKHLNDNDSGVSGTVAGIGAFGLQGEEVKSLWVKGGVGVEGEAGAGKYSVMLNGTTEGQMPNAWVAVSYQFEF